MTCTTGTGSSAWFHSRTQFSDEDAGFSVTHKEQDLSPDARLCLMLVGLHSGQKAKERAGGRGFLLGGRGEAGRGGGRGREREREILSSLCYWKEPPCHTSARPVIPPPPYKRAGVKAACLWLCRPGSRPGGRREMRRAQLPSANYTLSHLPALTLLCFLSGNPLLAAATFPPIPPPHPQAPPLRQGGSRSDSSYF